MERNSVDRQEHELAWKESTTLTQETTIDRRMEGRRGDVVRHRNMSKHRRRTLDSRKGSRKWKRRVTT